MCVCVKGREARETHRDVHVRVCSPCSGCVCVCVCVCVSVRVCVCVCVKEREAERQTEDVHVRVYSAYRRLCRDVCAADDLGALQWLVSLRSLPQRHQSGHL